MRKWLAVLMVWSCLGSPVPSSIALANDRAIQVGDQTRDQGRDQGKGDEEKRKKEEEERRRREEEKRKKEEEERRKREEEEKRKREEERRKEEERKKEEDKRKNNPPGKSPNPPGNPAPTNPPGNPPNPGLGNQVNPGRGPGSGKPQERSYYGQVTINASGQVRSGDTIVQSASPWLQLAAPGMWLEASGNWEDGIFQASEVKLHSPQSWSFYQGPASLVGASGYQSVSAWLSTNRQDPFIALKAASDSQGEVRLVAYFDGKKLRATPSTFPPPPAGLEVGWVELTGKIGSGGLVWVSAKAFP